jgi:transcriptional regulator with XRE-family HTH domain
MDTFSQRFNALKSSNQYTLDGIAVGISKILVKKGHKKISKAAVHRWSKGETMPSNEATWQALAQFFGRPASWLQRGKETYSTEEQELASRIKSLKPEHQDAINSMIDGLLDQNNNSNGSQGAA